MAINKNSTSSTTAMEKAKPDYLSLDCEGSSVHAIRKKATTAMRETAHVFRIMVCLHSAKDFPSVLRIYGIENTTKAGKTGRKTQLPNGKIHAENHAVAEDQFLLWVVRLFHVCGNVAGQEILLTAALFETARKRSNPVTTKGMDGLGIINVRFA